MMKQPERFNFSMIREAVEQSMPQGKGFLFNRDFAVLNGSSAGLFQYILSRQTPLIIDDYRLGLILEGEVHVSINLMEHHVGPGTLVFIGPGTIIQPISVSPQVRLKGIAWFHELPLTANRLPPLFNGTVRELLLPLTDEQRALVEQLMDIIWQTANAKPFCRETLDALAAALMQQYSHLHHIQTEQQARPSHANDIFNRFIQLVNAHARQQHQIDYYASRLCLTTRYLGTVVRQVSGVTAKEWIDRALVTEAKVMLKHTDEPVSAIAEALAFPNASFFCKYFRRITGQTPAEYRKG